MYKRYLHFGKLGMLLWFKTDHNDFLQKHECQCSPCIVFSHFSSRRACGVCRKNKHFEMQWEGKVGDCFYYHFLTCWRIKVVIKTARGKRCGPKSSVLERVVGVQVQTGCEVWSQLGCWIGSSVRFLQVHSTVWQGKLCLSVISDRLCIRGNF